MFTNDTTKGAFLLIFISRCAKSPDFEHQYCFFLLCKLLLTLALFRFNLFNYLIAVQQHVNCPIEIMSLPYRNETIALEKLKNATASTQFTVLIN
jgi:hypothetical protein